MRKMMPVVFEKYNEVTFYEPTERFYHTLQENRLDHYIQSQKQQFQNLSKEDYE